MAFDKYAYNTRSEVIGAQRYHGTDISDISRVYGGRGFGYNYDPIGNRTSASETIGEETLVKSSTANELNQYTAIANPDAVGLRGDATNTAVVSVNGEAASSDNVGSTVLPWHFALPADNADGGKYTFASIVGAVNPPGTNDADMVSTTSGSVYAPPQNETLTYDDDGNLLSDGHWQYTWNGENRLICAEEQVCPTNRMLRKVDYAYDHQGRMVWKKISHEDTNTRSWEEEKSTSYLWDDFNIIAEKTLADSATIATFNIWGLDLDGTMQGAGGVGGLLAVVKDSATVYFPCYDANGNVMEYISADGTIAAHREYDPFGNTVVYTDQSTITNQQSEITFTHWFSTKPWCPLTSISEYQFRKYSPVLGRWLNRDSIDEEGGLNLYGFCVNDGENRWDFWGLWTLDFSGFSPEQEADIRKAYRLLQTGIPQANARVLTWLNIVDNLPEECAYKKKLKEELLMLSVVLSKVQIAMDGTKRLRLRPRAMKDADAAAAFPFNRSADLIYFSTWGSSSLNSADPESIANVFLHELAHIAGVIDENDWKWGKDLRSQFAHEYEKIAADPTGFGIVSFVNYWSDPDLLGSDCCPPRSEWMINDGML